MCKQLIIEATIVGLATILVGVCVQELLKKTTLKVQCETPCDWNKNYIKEISLFITGFMLHVLFEIMGANSWYVKHGSAALSLKGTR
uniref:Uncharacterized protein n=1 Tax=viral metagenome TaxID=1070528 RepID=A0A6C0I6Q6_9ZZZZ